MVGDTFILRKAVSALVTRHDGTTTVTTIPKNSRVEVVHIHRSGRTVEVRWQGHVANMFLDDLTGRGAPLAFSAG
jgi:hypothetical protein